MPSFSSLKVNRYTLVLSVNVVSQDPIANTSTVLWVLNQRHNEKINWYEAAVDGQIVIGGEVVWEANSKIVNTKNYQSIYSGTVASGYTTVSHYVHSSLIVPVSANLKTVDQSQSWSVPYLSLSGTFELPRHNRYPEAPENGPYALTPSPLDESRTLTVRSYTAYCRIPILEYQIEIKEVTSPGNETIHLTANSNLEITFSPGDAPKTFEFRSRARSEVGWGPYSPVRSYVLAWRPRALPSPFVTHVSRTITVLVPEADASGTPIIEYQLQIKAGSAQAYTVNVPARTRTYSFSTFTASPLTIYDFTARARSSAGWGPWGTSYATIRSGGTGPKVRISGVYTRTNAFVKASGTWRPAAVWVKDEGQWKQIIV